MSAEERASANDLLRPVLDAFATPRYAWRWVSACYHHQESGVPPLAVVVAFLGDLIPESPTTWLWLGLAVALVAILFYVGRHYFFLRLPNWFFTHTLYRLRVSGLENVPAEG